MKEAVLVMIKPDGMRRKLVGGIFNKLSAVDVKLVGMRITHVSKELAQAHYRNIKGTPFYNEVIDYILGKFHKKSSVIALVYYGENAIRKLRKIAGATNPEIADPTSIRGAYGRITTKGVFENVIHVSSGRREAEREIKLWFEPDELLIKIFPTKKRTLKSESQQVWA